MGEQDADYDYTRYRRLLLEAVDETKQLALIDLMIREKARDRLQAQRLSDRYAVTAAAVARMLEQAGRGTDQSDELASAPGEALHG